MDSIVELKTEPEISFLFPVYNEARIIEKVILGFYNEVNSQVPIEIVVAEDGSTDGTKSVLLELSKKIPMKIIFGKDRKGYSQGLIDGLSKIDTKYTVFVDSDGQHLASDFWKLYSLRNEYDIVTGWRIKRVDAIHRKLISWVFQRIAQILFRIPRYHDLTGPYRLMDTATAKKIANQTKYMKESFWTEFTIRAYYNGFKSKEVPVTHRQRLDGDTNVYKPNKLFGIIVSQLKGIIALRKEMGSF